MDGEDVMGGKLKGFSFGECSFDRTKPGRATLSPSTKKLNIVIGFEEALKLHLAIGECISQLNRYKHSTTAGKRAAVNLCVSLDSKRVSVNEDRTTKGQ